MKPSFLVKRSLRYYRHFHCLLFLGVMLTTVIMTGSFLVGRSVKTSLQNIAKERLAKVHHAAQLHGRYFTESLSQKIGDDSAAYLHLKGSVFNPDLKTKVSGIEIYGIDDSFKPFMSTGFDRPEEDSIVLNERLAKSLKIKEGEELILRMENPSLLSRDAALIDIDDALVSIRLKVKTILSKQESGDFSLKGQQLPVMNAFIHLKQMQSKLDLHGLCNGLVASEKVVNFAESIKENMSLSDYGLELRSLAKGWFEVSSRRVFITPSLEEAIIKHIPETKRMLTFFVNKLEGNNKTTPYSTVTAIESSLRWQGLFDSNLNGDEVLISDWLKDDLGLQKGDALEITYYEISDDRSLSLEKSSFKVKDSYSINGMANDPKLMPNIPGLTDSDHCRDWDAGIPIETNKIRNKDEDYWETYKGTPKAFIQFEKGKSIWANRFGSTTSLSFLREGEDQATWTKQLLDGLSPEMVGLVPVAVQQGAMNGIDASMDFTGLFIGLSFFIVLSSILITGMFYAFMIEDRRQEIGLFKALGFHAKQIRTKLLKETMLMAIPGVLLGGLLSLLYTKGILWALNHYWQGAVAGLNVDIHYAFDTLVMGMMVSLIVSFLSIIYFHRKVMKHRAVQLMNQNVSLSSQLVRSRSWPKLLGGSLLLISMLWTVLATQSSTVSYEIFFGIGSLVFAGLLLMVWDKFSLKPKNNASMKSLNDYSRASVSRNLSRSLTTIFLIASGLFLVASLGAFRLLPPKDPLERNSGTGGFTLYMQTATPLYETPSTEKGLEVYDIEKEDLKNVSMVPFRKTGGDDASCLNLMRASLPALYGVPSDELINRKAFKFSKSLGEYKVSPWELLKAWDNQVIPAIVDEATMMWNLKMGLGDTLEYTMENGKPIQIKLVATLKNSMLQGQVIIDESALLKAYPSLSGSTLYLVDAPLADLEKVQSVLNDAFEREGIQIFPSQEILEKFNEVQNTYLTIFEILGSFGVLLGTLGLGIIIFRGVLERREQLAVMEAIGFELTRIRAMLSREHGLLLLYGIGIGLIASVFSILPHVLASFENLPIKRLSLSIALITISGLLWTHLATRFALKGSLIKQLNKDL